MTPIKSVVVSAVLFALAGLHAGCVTPSRQAPQIEHVILITIDGLRWQELFTGADADLIGDEDFVDDPAALKTEFWHDDSAIRRAKLMPFFWSVIAEEGQLHGNRAYGNRVDVTNDYWFSYPGYNEILTGYADPRISSNAKIDNPNVTVLEYINSLAGFRDSVAAFGSWDMFPYIINETRSKIPVNAGFRQATGDDLTQRERFLNELQPLIPSPWATVRLDAFTHHYAMEYLRKYSPRLLYIAYGETDDFAHDGEYDQYLKAARRTDAFISEIWNWVQSNATFRDTTTLLITTDHGRGMRPQEAWKHHGKEASGSDQIWFAAIGPKTAPLGEIKTAGRHYQDQVARTIAVLLGVDYTGDGKAGNAIDAVINR